MMETLFEWDDRKSQANHARHGVWLEDACEIWSGTHLIVPAKNVSGESRHAALGHIHGKLFLAIFTRRDAAIRLISCHRADKRWTRTWRSHVEGEEGHA